MAITSSLSIDLDGDLSDIPLGQNGDITRLPNGGYAVIAEAAGLGFSILRVFDADGNAVRSIGIQGTDPGIAALSDGRIAVQTTIGSIYTTRLVSADFQTVTDVAANSGRDSTLAARADGTFVAAHTVQFSTDADLFLTYRDNAGVAGLFINVENDTSLSSSDPDVAVLSNSRVVLTRTQTVVATGATSLVVSVFDAAGQRAFDDIVIPDSAGAGGENSHARVAATANGFAVVYSTRVFGSGSLDIRLRTFDQAGAQTGDTLITNSDFGQTGTDDGFDDTAPEIAIAPDGNIAVTWTRSDGLNTDQMLVVVGSAPQVVGSGDAGDLQGQPLVTFFGAGRIAAYHVNDAQDALVGEHFAGFRESVGDDGNDTFAGDDFRDRISGLGGRDSLSGGNGNDTVQGGDGQDTLAGGAGDDLLQGEAGAGALGGGKHHDQISGGDGNDTLLGETGNDRLDGGNNDDRLDGGAGKDSLEGRAGADALFGGDGNDFLGGGENSDTVDGGTGNDSFFGDSGDDSLIGGTGNDTVSGGSGFDTLSGGDGLDRLFGDGEADQISGGIGNDSVFGGDGSDSLSGDEGDDSVDGGNGLDTLSGGAGVDRLNGNEDSDQLSGDAGNDLLTGDNGGDLLFGGGDADIVNGGNDADLVSGDEGNDTLRGDGGTDTLRGGLGLDELTGGLDADRFEFFDAVSGLDTITDFVSGTDRIGLLAFGFGVIGAAVNSGELRFGTGPQDANDFLVYNAATGTLSFDADGNGAASATVAFASLGAGTVLLSTDFVVF